MTTTVLALRIERDLQMERFVVVLEKSLPSLDVGLSLRELNERATVLTNYVRKNYAELCEAAQQDTGHRNRYCIVQKTFEILLCALLNFRATKASIAFGNTMNELLRFSHYGFKSIGRTNKFKTALYDFRKKLGKGEDVFSVRPETAYYEQAPTVRDYYNPYVSECYWHSRNLEREVHSFPFEPYVFNPEPDSPELVPLSCASSSSSTSDSLSLLPPFDDDVIGAQSSLLRPLSTELNDNACDVNAPPNREAAHTEVYLHDAPVSFAVCDKTNISFNVLSEMDELPLCVPDLNGFSYGALASENVESNKQSSADDADSIILPSAPWIEESCFLFPTVDMC